MNRCTYCSKDLTYDLSTNENGLCETCAADPEILEDIKEQDQQRKEFNSYYHNYISEYEN